MLFMDSKAYHYSQTKEDSEWGLGKIIIDKLYFI